MARILLSVLFVPLCFFAEPSAFEKQSGVTKNDLKVLQQLVATIQQKVDSIEQSIDGVSSLYESQSSKLQKVSVDSAQQQSILDELKTELEMMKKNVDSNSNDIKSIQLQVKALNDSVSKLSANVVNELSKLNNQAESKSNNAKFEKNKAKKDEIFKDAKNLLTQKKYSEASERFVWLVEINHKKAQCHFYLGEISFESKKYSDAISHYKQSVMLDDKATYMPLLLLHSAQSFKATNDVKNYNKFLDSLIKNYPSSNEAQSAKKLKSKDKK